MHLFLAVLLLAGVTLAGRAAEADSSEQPTAEQREFFEKRIRPILAESCYSCHSAESEKVKADLRVDSRAGILAGGDSGPAAIPGDPDGSLLVKAVRYTSPDLQMPPKKGKLASQNVEDLISWVRMGMPWPVDKSPAAPAGKRVFAITDEDRSYWAFRPIVRPTPAIGQGNAWVRNPIDAFILTELNARGLTPNPRAGARELIRRVYFDLLGLPPTPAEVAAFTRDNSPDAWARLVDDVLARPEYGERWARHWLDVVRYAQSNGYERDGEKPLAWRYRDYVIDALNEDKPYDRFIMEQIAGDELPDATAQSVAATGFQRLGVWDDEPDDAQVAEYDGLDDIVSTTSTAFLGLTLGCARCHDHKFDPIAQADYYQFLSFFRNVRPNENPRFALDSASYLPLVPPRAARDWQRAREIQIQELDSAAACAVEGTEKAELLARLQKLRDQKPPFEWTLGVRERGVTALPTRVLIRGNPHSPGAEVTPAFLTVLGGEKPELPEPTADAGSTGRRRALAQWIASRQNPLTARVAVNRVWSHYFGQGLVKTTGDFGRAGSAPTHPALLDWLAAEFMDNGWSFKRLHRAILLSSTYQMSSMTQNQAAQALDPGNDLLWRQRLRRLEAEGVWDSVLAVSGELNKKAGGRGFFPQLDGEVLAGQSRPGLDWEVSTPAEQSRRSIYTYIRRTMLVPLLEAFDYNNTTSPLTERPVTTVAPQALMLLNASWAEQRAAAFARRLERESGLDPVDRIITGYQLALGRLPTEPEIGIARALVKRQEHAARALSSRLTFRPDLPPSLFGEFMKQLHPSDYLRGPSLGWQYYIGRWSAGYEGIRSLDRDRGPFALWSCEPFENGVIEATVLLDPAADSGSLLFRSTAEKNEQRGYELALEPRRKRVVLRRHGSRLEQLAEAGAVFAPGQPTCVRIELEGPTIRVWLGATEERSGLPLFDVTDPGPVTAGFAGVRASGAAITFERMQIQLGSRVIDLSQPEYGRTQGRAGMSPGSQSEAAGWQSFCLLLLNLNEFVYVD